MLISVEALHQQLGQPGLVVFDCRFVLGQPNTGRNQYLEGHIPGAFYLDLEQDLSGPRSASGGRHPLPNPAVFADKLGSAGVDGNTKVVVYDAGTGMATRAWWLLRYHGVSSAAVLDGGWKAWLDAGFPVDRGIPNPVPTKFPVSLQSHWIVPVSEVEAIAKGSGAAVLVDARAANRYRGEDETIDPVAGHIPTAKNAPWMEGVAQNGHWRSAEEQRERFSQMGDPSRVIHYCGSGVTACANLFAMELAGLKGARLYPGSWSDWVSDPERPTEQGNS